MQIVIDIPEDLKKMIFDDEVFDIAHSYRLAMCVKNGTPLPKEQEPCEDCVSRQEALDCFTATKLKKFDFILYAREEIKKLPPVHPKQTECEDCISREAAINIIYDYEYKKDMRKALDGLPSVHPKQTECEDCISRQAAIDLADELKDDLPDDDRLSDMVMSHNEGILEYQTKLSLLPPVQPKQTKSCYKMCDRWQRMGRWKPYDGSWYECSECGAVREAVGFFENYCPNCGAKMREVEE